MTVVPQIAEAAEPAAASIGTAEAAFERWRRLSGAVAAPAGFLITWLLSAGVLEPAGQNVAAVLVAVAVLWITEALPLPVTAVVGPMLCILLGVANAKTVLAPFADPIVFLFIGSFILARAMMLHRLDRRVALAFLQLPWIGGRRLPWTLRRLIVASRMSRTGRGDQTVADASAWNRQRRSIGRCHRRGRWLGKNGFLRLSGWLDCVPWFAPTLAWPGRVPTVPRPRGTNQHRSADAPSQGGQPKKQKNWCCVPRFV